MPQPTNSVEKNEPEKLAGEQPQPVAEVELDAATGKPVEAVKPAEPSVSAEDFKKLQSRYEYQARQFERSQRELQQELSQLRNVPQPAVHAEKPSDDDRVYGYTKEELNAMGQTDWTKPVDKISRAAAKEVAREEWKLLMAEQEKKQKEQVRQQMTTNILEREKQWVLEQEPSLNDESSEQFRGFYGTYNRLIQEDPSLLQNPRAPRLVYREWKAESKSVTAAPVADPETERLKRVAGGVSPQGRPASSPKTIKLTQDEVEFCQNKGISPAVYASMKDANFKEGVTA